ncbi:NAD(P)-dependent oxidoreductase [Candidatus Parcubacteria bacterium]|nr:NAD(P)-dependent oxidoreductase [Candidatus Parcubacteria bacterium]
MKHPRPRPPKSTNPDTDRVLITGATGFVGANLARALVQQGRQVAVITRQNSNPWRLAEVQGSLEQHVADLADAPALRQIVQKVQPTVIFHAAAASVYGDQVPATESEMVRSNLIGTMNLIRACADINYRCFVNTGSSSEYGPKTEPMVETDLAAPRDIYGVTKCAATHFAAAVARQEHKPILTLRLFSPFGPYDDPRRLIPTAIVAALTSRDIKLARPEIGRDYVFIDDVVAAYLAAVERARENEGEIINIGSGRQTTLEETVATLFTLVKSPGRALWGAAPGSPQDNPLWQADIEKARERLGWQPRVAFREGLRQTVEWFREHLDRYAFSP